MKKVSIVLISFFMFMQMAHGQGSGISDQSFFKKSGNNILFKNPLYELCSSSQRCAKVWANAIDATSAVIGGLSPGALTIAVDDANAFLVETAANVGKFNVNTVTGLTSTVGISMESPLNTFYGIFLPNPDNGLMLGINRDDGVANGHFIVTDVANLTKDHGLNTPSEDPKICVYSKDDVDIDSNKFICMYHDGENGNIYSNTGNLVFPYEMQTPLAIIQDTVPELVFVDTNTISQNPGMDIIVNATNTGVGTEDFDIFWEVVVNGGQRVLYYVDGDGGTGGQGLLNIGDSSGIQIRTDNTLSMGDTVTYEGGVSQQFAGGYQVVRGIDDGQKIGLNNTDGEGNNNLIITTISNIGKDHDNATLNPDPTIILTSSTDPDTNNQEKVYLSHDKSDFRISPKTGGTVFESYTVAEPSTDQSLLATDTLTVTNDLMRIVGNGGAVSLTSTPNIADFAIDGKCVIIQGTSNTNTVTIQDEANNPGSNLQLSGDNNFLMGQGDMIELCFDTGDSYWYEISRSDN